MDFSSNSFLPFPELSSGSFNLIRVTVEKHTESIFRLFNQPKVTQYIEGISTFKEAGEAAQFISVFDKAYQHYHSAILWGICPKDSDNLIGLISLYEIQEDSAKIFCALHPDCWNQNIMQQCIKEIILYCFTHTKIEIITASVMDGNFRSNSLLLKCGFMHEKKSKNTLSITRYIKQ